jgi:hypothetical protein
MINKMTREIAVNFRGFPVPAHTNGASMGTLAIPAGYTLNGTSYQTLNYDVGSTGRYPATIGLGTGANASLNIFIVIPNQFSGSAMGAGSLYGQLHLAIDAT